MFKKGQIFKGWGLAQKALFNSETHEMQLFNITLRSLFLSAIESCFYLRSVTLLFHPPYGSKSWKNAVGTIKTERHQCPWIQLSEVIEQYFVKCVKVVNFNWGGEPN